ncbi:hypothetical protein OJ997_27200 [Solirubrobacter phytolaccae]|uniref:Uncharacterized protein n=1 Tax=Solirubrobacter phytolaccae TaxID=1404360 RepID=A0A9X3SDS8_9ACTN|nr:hypothetical protein [Solirubrobacter phytolaccae]MDA0184025.1 hypothetical protein [Solirubrobacter phytolaccae]
MSATSRTTRVGTDPPAPDERFARVCARLGFDHPDWFAPRRAAVLSTLEATTRLTSPQLRTMARAQSTRLRPTAPNGVAFSGELRAALGCAREEARLHGRLVALGQAWAGSNQVVALVTAREPGLTPVVATAVAGEVLCRLLGDIRERRVLSLADEDMLRSAWSAAHPLPAYFRRPART